MPSNRTSLAMFSIVAIVLWCGGVLCYGLLLDMAALWPLPWPALATGALTGIGAAAFFTVLLKLVARLVTHRPAWFAALVLIGAGPLVTGFLWPLRLEEAKTLDATAALVRESGREEVVISGFVNDPATPPLGLQKLTIQEPDRPVYERLVALSPDRTFELVLGEPRPGKYLVTVHWGAERRANGPAKKIALPALEISPSPETQPSKVWAKDFDYWQLFLLPLAAILAAGVLLLIPFRRLLPVRTNHQAS